MAEIKHVTGTAFIVAEWRAEENAAPDPLYRDSIVELCTLVTKSESARSLQNRSPRALST